MSEENPESRKRSTSPGRGRGGGKIIRPITLGGRDTISVSGATVSTPLEQPYGPSEAFPIELALAEATGPWSKDRITLSLEAQSLLLEMKTAARSILEFAGQIYSNVISQLKVAAGRFLILEPFGGYRILWKN